MAGATNTWIKFFTDAGIPSGIAASYALTFASNRIRMDMLLDLNKEYLKDMGITPMGDVISILRHAKHVHEQNARDKILGTSTSVSSSLQKSSPASRMLDHYMRKTDTSSNDGGGGCIGDDDASTKRAVPLEKQKANVPSTPVLKAKKQTIKTKFEEEVQAPPAKKVRRVLPEHEGRYKITMPSGSTPRTQRILAKHGMLTQKKKTVFDRLGDGSVTSTTESEGPSITITGLGLNIVKPATSTSEKQSSVFSRLGEKPQVSSTSNQDLLEDKSYLEDIPASRERVLPYAGVLKQEPRKKIVKKVQIQKIKVPTMQADFESARQVITDNGRVVSKAVKLQERLGASVSDGRSSLHTLKSPSTGKVVKKIVRTNKATAGILANPTNARKLSVKARLGNSDSETSPSTTTEPDIRRKKIILVKKTGEKVTTITNRAQKLILNTTKSVTFGGVTKKTFIPRESITSSTNHNKIVLSNNVTTSIGASGIRKGPGSVTTKTGVFSRLGS